MTRAERLAEIDRKIADAWACIEMHTRIINSHGDARKYAHARRAVLESEKHSILAEPPEWVHGPDGQPMCTAHQSDSGDRREGKA
jgi:hypothetical protein